MADEIQQQQQEHAQLQQEQLQQQAEQPEQLAQQTEQTQQTQQQENLDQVEQQQQQPDEQQQQQPDEQLGDQDMDHQEESNEQEESDDQDMDQETQAHVQQQRQRELDKLHAIDAKVRQVHERLTSRLPRQRAHLSAKVCGVVWAVRASAATAAAAAMQSSEERGAVTTSTTTTTSTTDSLAKKLRLELGAFDYQVREQGELLTRYLCDLDDVLSFGDAAIKDARKALVVFIQSEALPLADALREQSAKLRAFGERLISTLPVESSAVPPPSPSPSPSESQSQATQSDSPMKVPSQSTAASGSDAVDSDVDVDMHPLFGTDDEEDASDDNNDVVDDDDGVSDEDVESGVDDSEDEEMANEDDDREDEHNSIEEEQAPAATSTPAAVDTRSLPVWKPYYQIHKRRDALYLVANLRDVDPQNVRVQWLERADGGGVLHISGVKLPTQRDVLVSRFSGVPTFGRFEIAERVPSASAVDMSRASQTLREDGTLEVRMPYAYSGSSSSSSRTAGIPCSISSDYPRYSVSGYPYSPRSYPYPHPHDYHRRQQQQQQPQYHQELHHPMHPLQQYYQQQQGYPRSAFRRRVSPWFDAPRCVVW